jgi:peptidylprolyl isomerase
MKKLLLVTASMAAAGCMRHRSPELPAPIPAIAGERKEIEVELEYIDFVTGTGAPMESRKCVYTHYTGWLTDGTKFDSSRDLGSDGQPRQPISFSQGTRRVIMGWDMGFDGMRVGGKRRLIIPHQLAYGEAGRSSIPPRSTLVFDVELMAVADTLPRAAQPAPAAGGAAPQPAQCPTWSAVSGK